MMSLVDVTYKNDFMSQTNVVVLKPLAVYVSSDVAETQAAKFWDYLLVVAMEQWIHGCNGCLSEQPCEGYN